MRIQPIVSLAQQASALALLDEGFKGGETFWRTAFLAPPGRFGHGLLLETEGHCAVGVILLFESERGWGGQRRRVVNLSSWFIRPEYRAHALNMICQATADKAGIYTNFSPSGSVQKLMTALGFRYVWQGALQSVPLLNGLSSGSGVVIEDADTVAHQHQIKLTPTEIVPLPKRYVWVKARMMDRVVDVVFRIILWRGRRIGQLTYSSDHRTLRCVLASLHWHMLFRHRMLALLLPLLPVYAGLKSVRKSPYGPVAMVRGNIPDEQVDMLQSEFHYLPLNF